MKELATFIEIDAKPDVVWRHVLAFRAYPEWNPFITAISGHPVLGEKISLTMKLKTEGGRNQANHTITPRIVKFEDEHEIRLEHGAWFSWLLTIEHWFRITQRKGGVKFHQCMRVEGLLTTVMKDDYFAMFREGFTGMNAALKRRVESLEAPAMPGPSVSRAAE
ncbi:MAG: SRPBCC domain-containing protein [Rhodospirillaceae bacterium]|nr:SRPBCC domain-containing protein [Rhodospirillaceae bacterium]